MTNRYIGSFETKSDKIIVTDPCYSKGTWCQHIMDECFLGKWHSYVNYSDETSSKNRVSSIRIVHDSFHNVSHKFSRRVDCTIGVDSGQAGFFDESRYHENGRGEYEDSDSFYGKVCELTLSTSRAGVIEYGACSNSGYGDGSYDLFIVRKGGRIVAAEIVFISDEDYEDYEEYEERAEA